MHLFDNFFDQVKEYEKPKDEKKYVNFCTTVEYKISTLVEMINNVDSISDEELKGVIIRQHKMLLSYDPFLSNQNNRKSALKLFTNKRFLNLFLEVIKFLNLTREEVVCINKLAYDYYVSDNKNVEISELLLSICYLINNNLIVRLSAKMSLTNARILSMIANSTFKVEKKVHRVNAFFLKKDNENEFTVQDYIDIYMILFDHFLDLFTYSMLEAWNIYPIVEDYEILQYERFLKTSGALMIMLDSLTSKDIETVLRNYGYTLSVISNKSVRFSIKNTKYERIKQIAYNLEINEGDIKIP